MAACWPSRQRWCQWTRCQSDRNTSENPRVPQEPLRRDDNFCCLLETYHSLCVLKWKNQYLDENTCTTESPLRVCTLWQECQMPWIEGNWASDQCRSFDSYWQQIPGQAKVCYFDCTVLVNQKVLRLKVPAKIVILCLFKVYSKILMCKLYSSLNQSFWNINSQRNVYHTCEGLCVGGRTGGLEATGRCRIWQALGPSGRPLAH